MNPCAAALCCAGVLARIASAADPGDVWKQAGAGDGLRQAFERAIYSLNDAGRGTWRGENRAQRLALEFDSVAARLRHPNGSLDIRLTGFGYGDQLAKPAAATLTSKGNRLEYRRGDLTEWYENGSQGLEQGFTLTHRPAASRRAELLTIALGVTGDLAPAQNPKDGAVLLKSARGVVLRYAGLTARDARGRMLPSRMEARGHEIRLLVEDRDAQYPLVVDPTWSQQAELTASDGAASDLFGVSVAVSGGTAVIGAYQHQVGSNSNQGAAYVFVQSGTSWSQQAELTASDGAEGDQFGVSVAVSGGTALIAADGSNSSQGAAYVFVRSGTSWSQQAKLTASDGAGGDRFGVSVAVSGGTAVIGANQHTVGINGNQGAAYVFVQSGTSWSQQAELTASDGAASDLFGSSVAVSGGTAVIGAYAHQVGTNSAQGAAYVFVQTGTSWSPQAELTASDGLTGDEFGRSVAVSGGTVLIGADGSNLFEGAAYVFVQSGTSWSQQAELTASDGAGGDQFGVSVAVSGGTAVIGANLHTVGMNGNQGAAYAFAQSGTDWSEQAELTASEGAASDFFGSSVAVSGGTAVIGSFGSNSLQGAAYAFVSPASLSVSATHSSPIFQAGPGTITLTVSNTGSATNEAATVSDTIDSAFTINSASSGCIVSGQDVTCTLASGSSGPSTAFSVYVTASATAPASISNTATLTDSIDTITGGSSSDTIPVGTLAPLVDSSLTQLVLSGSTDTGTCAAGNRTLTATDLLQNTGESTLTNPYPVNATVSQGNTLLSQSADSAIVAPGATVTFTFHIGLASCNTFQLSFDVRSN
jgi:nucleoside-specific outer membrane channel protein Tsx